MIREPFLLILRLRRRRLRLRLLRLLRLLRRLLLRLRLLIFLRFLLLLLWILLVLLPRLKPLRSCIHRRRTSAITFPLRILKFLYFRAKRKYNRRRITLTRRHVRR